MKIFGDMEKALISTIEKPEWYLNSFCPYKKERLCGSWCALFHYSPAVANEYKRTGAYVILGCKVDQKRLYIDEVID
jgi:hypothetical protein